MSQQSAESGVGEANLAASLLAVEVCRVSAHSLLVRHTLGDLMPSSMRFAAQRTALGLAVPTLLVTRSSGTLLASRWSPQSAPFSAPDASNSLMGCMPPPSRHIQPVSQRQRQAVHQRSKLKHGLEHAELGAHACRLRSTRSSESWLLRAYRSERHEAHRIRACALSGGDIGGELSEKRRLQ